MPDSLEEEVKSEVHIFFLDDGSDGVTYANAVTRGGSPPDVTTKEIWGKVFTYSTRDSTLREQRLHRPLLLIFHSAIRARVV